MAAPRAAAPPIASVSRAPTLLGASLPASLQTKPAGSAPVAAAMTGNGADFAKKLGSLGLSQEQIEGELSLSREVVERVVWEVVPTRAETMIREEIARLTKD
jgi:hypothetical protein